MNPETIVMLIPPCPIRLRGAFWLWQTIKREKRDISEQQTWLYGTHQARLPAVLCSGPLQNWSSTQKWIKANVKETKKILLTCLIIFWFAKRAVLQLFNVVLDSKQQYKIVKGKQTYAFFVRKLVLTITLTGY